MTCFGLWLDSMPNTKSGNTRKDRSENYGDPNFKGRGIIRCRVCGGKLRDHPMRPCQSLGEQVIHGDPRARSQRTEVAKPISPK